MKKKNYIIGGILLLLIGVIVAIFLLRNNEETDAIKFSKQYTSVPKENVFIYKDIDEIIQIMEHFCPFFIKCRKIIRKNKTDTRTRAI